MDSVVQEDSMFTLAARLASFEVAHPAPKRRSSSTKAATKGALKWPHTSPSPEQLALAGFFYKPAATSPDNVQCFMCEKSMDGWEEEDDPIAEHLKHVSNCAWAITASIAAMPQGEEIDDPMLEDLVEARTATFGERWPHEGKRGWNCKVKKMVNAGWHFCPTPESEDFVSCAHCKLSLDGWEPKDDPYDEHQRRSPECPFFAFVTKKNARVKKRRASKASRLSIQSNITTMTEPIDTTELDSVMDNSTMSTATTSSKAGGKKKKGKTSRVKDEPEANMIDMDSVAAEPGPKAAKKGGRGRKRTSDQMSVAEDEVQEASTVEQEDPPPKRRATRSRASTAASDVGTEDELSVIEPTKKGRGKGKRAASRSRKVSGVSTASVASLRAQIPDDDEIDAALEADLNRSDEEREPEAEAEQEAELPKKASKRGPAKSKSKASVASTRAKKGKAAEVEKPAPEPEAVVVEEEDAPMPQAVEEEPEVVEEPLPKTKAKKATGRKKATKKEAEPKPDEEMPEEQAEQIPVATKKGRGRPKSTDSVASQKPQVGDESAVTNQPADDSGNEADASPVAKPKKKTTTKKATKKAPGKKSGPVAAAKEAEVVIDNRTPDLTESFQTAQEDQRSASKAQEEPNDEIVPFEDTTPVKKQSKGKGKGKAESIEPEPVVDEDDETTAVPDVAMASFHSDGPGPSVQGTPGRHVPSTPMSSPGPPLQESTPSPSPQPSDAENQPPSSRPSTARPPVPSPLTAVESQTIRIPLAPTTPRQPSPSKRNALNGSGYLHSTYPWTATDLEAVFLSGASDADKENVNLEEALRSAKDELPDFEKKMTVEEWIRFQAKRAEDKLKAECERLVSAFEKEGGRAMMALEGIECVE